MLRSSLTWGNEQRNTSQQRDYLAFGLARTGVCVMLQNDEFEYEYIANLPQVWKSPVDKPPVDSVMFGQTLGTKLKTEKAELLDTGMVRNFEWTTLDGSTFEFIIELVFDHDKGRKVFTTVRDLTSERQRENVLRTLLKEVSHRSKNLLAMVQSVAFQTARHSDSLDRFIERFRGRIQSISYSQDVITQTDWQGAEVAQLIERQKLLFSPTVQKLIHFEGENVILSPNATMHLGLALHELISNATRYGNFIEKNDDIKIEVDVSPIAEGGMEITLQWHEHVDAKALQAVQADNKAKKQFGSVVLERIVPSAVSGNAQITLDEDVMTYQLKFPLTA